MIFFTLPNYIRVMVSKYQPLQTIFAIDKSECQTREIKKKDEQFSPTVTVVDTAKGQPLDCVLLLHGEKLPEVNHRTLFCYIAVQVSYDAHGSHPYPLYHVESKPCKQSKLPLIFCFYKPGTVCNIRLSVHSIVDSEGVEYMYCSESCDCIVRIIDRDQHEGIEMRDQHGVVRTKEPPLLRYTGSLATDKYHELEKQFTKGADRFGRIDPVAAVVSEFGGRAPPFPRAVRPGPAPIAMDDASRATNGVHDHRRSEREGPPRGRALRGR